ncbi:MAG: hypothetical protein ACQEXJ_01850 [Myxococcota bacterium]
MKAVRLLVLASLLMGACGGDPEAQSGGDAYRHQAELIPLDEWVTDDISVDDADRTDWKALDVPSAGTLTIQFHADEPEAEITVGLFDRYGRPLGDLKRGEGQGRVQAEIPIRSAGRHFVMIREADGPPTSYMIRASLGGADAGGAGRPGF